MMSFVCTKSLLIALNMFLGQDITPQQTIPIEKMYACPRCRRRAPLRSGKKAPTPPKKREKGEQNDG